MIYAIIGGVVCAYALGMTIGYGIGRQNREESK